MHAQPSRPKPQPDTPPPLDTSRVSLGVSNRPVDQVGQARVWLPSDAIRWGHVARAVQSGSSVVAGPRWRTATLHKLLHELGQARHASQTCTSPILMHPSARYAPPAPPAAQRLHRSIERSSTGAGMQHHLNAPPLFPSLLGFSSGPVFCCIPCRFVLFLSFLSFRNLHWSSSPALIPCRCKPCPSGDALTGVCVADARFSRANAK